MRIKYFQYTVEEDKVIMSRETLSKLKQHILELEQEIEKLQEYIDVIEEENSIDPLYHLE